MPSRQSATLRNPEGYIGPNPCCMKVGCAQEARYQFGVHPNWAKASLAAIAREAAMLSIPSELPSRVWYCPQHAGELYQRANTRAVDLSLRPAMA